MPVTIVGLKSVSAALSPLSELGSALHAAGDPGHHAADLPPMGAGLRRRARRWAFATRAIRATPFVTVWGPDDGFAAQVDHLRALPARRLAAQLIRPISPAGDTAAALRYARARGLGDLVAALVERPAPAVTEFLEFLSESWDTWFAQRWPAVRPVLAARARRFALDLAARGPTAALASLDPAITAAGAGVSIAKVASRRHDVSRRGLVVVPSNLIRPHLYVADVPGRPLVLIHPVEAGPPVLPTRDLLRRLTALANPGRLEVARAIATEPRTAGEIADLWHVDPTLVNRHLRALAAAGVARASRRGRFVQYELDAGAVDALGGDLLGLLLR
jgi:DNA-binding transcriptional ArsR family regulator